MMQRGSGSRRRNTPQVLRALDEASFGPARTLNLRTSLPTGVEAVRRAEAWLRERQMANAGEVLVITGRGNSSPDGISVVRSGVEKLFYSLRRRGVIESWREHTAGAFVVSLAPVTSLFEAPLRKREPRAPRPATPPTLAGLSRPTVELLRQMAVRSLETLGVRDPSETFIVSEMLSTFAKVSAALPPGRTDETALQDALTYGLAELEQ